MNRSKAIWMNHQADDGQRMNRSEASAIGRSRRMTRRHPEDDRRRIGNAAAFAWMNHQADDGQKGDRQKDDQTASRRMTRRHPEDDRRRIGNAAAFAIS